MNGMLLTALAGAWLVACAPAGVPDTEGAGGAPDLQVDRTSVRPGGEIRITLTNRSAAVIGYNLCAASLERRDAGQWVAVPDTPAEICTMELRTLQPGGTDSFTHTIPGTVQAGEYRFRTGVEAPLGASQVGVTSNPFTVVP